MKYRVIKTTFGDGTMSYRVQFRRCFLWWDMVGGYADSVLWYASAAKAFAAVGRCQMADTPPRDEVVTELV